MEVKQSRLAGSTLRLCGIGLVLGILLQQAIAGPAGATPPVSEVDADQGWVDDAIGEPVGDPWDLEDIDVGGEQFCTASADAPYYEEYKTVSHGSGNCAFPGTIPDEYKSIGIRVCIYVRNAGTWEPAKCRTKGPLSQDFIQRTVRDWCEVGQTKKYRTRVLVAGAYTNPNNGSQHFDRDTDKATNEFLCPINTLQNPDVIWMVEDELETIGP